MNYPQGGTGWQQTTPPNMPLQGYPGQPYVPGYYVPPPPPKKSNAWLWVLLALLLVIVLAVGGYIGFVAVESNRQWTVTYRVTGTGNSAAVRYSVREGGTTRENVHLPWAKDATLNASTAFVLEATPATDRETVTCEVRVNGKLVASNITFGGPKAGCYGFTPNANRFL